MWQNNGQEESDILQNQFTAYLSLAVQRSRRDYIARASRQNAEIPTSDISEQAVSSAEQDMISLLPLMMQLENDHLFYALKELNDRERHVFLARTLDGRDFSSLAKELGLGYKGVTAVYYRAIKKIRNWMEG